MNMSPVPPPIVTEAPVAPDERKTSRTTIATQDKPLKKTPSERTPLKEKHRESNVNRAPRDKPKTSLSKLDSKGRNVERP